MIIKEGVEFVTIAGALPSIWGVDVNLSAEVYHALVEILATVLLGGITSVENVLFTVRSRAEGADIVVKLMEESLPVIDAAPI